MRRIEKVAGSGLAKALLRRAPALALRYQQRCQNEFIATLDNGEEVAVALPEGTVLRDGSALIAQDGGCVRIEAAPEKVLKAGSPDPAITLRAAYYLGNGHTPVQIDADQMLLEDTPGQRQKLLDLGLTVVALHAPFDPIPDAGHGGHGHHHHAHDHGHAHTHGHGHGHDHDHEHKHGHGHDHDHGHAHKHGHEHDHDHGHAHKHGHGHDHDHGHEHKHGHEHDHAQGHQHGPDCGHEHDHAHDDHGHGGKHAGDHDHDHAAGHAHKHDKHGGPKH